MSRESKEKRRLFPDEGDVAGFDEGFAVGVAAAGFPDVDALAGELVFVIAVPAIIDVGGGEDLLSDTVVDL